MSLFVLDTDILTLYQFKHPQVCRRVSEKRPEELATTIITVEEQLSGWYTLVRQAKNREKLAGAYQRLTDGVVFFSRLQILSFTEAAIDKFEELKAEKLGVKKKDLRIAAIALTSSAKVVTRNRRDFERVPGLQIEDWSA